MSGRGARIASVLLSASLVRAGAETAAPASAAPDVPGSTAASGPSRGRAALDRGVSLRKERPVDAAPVLEEALRLLKEEGDLAGQAEAQRNLGVLERMAGRDDGALLRYETALDLARRSNDDQVLAAVLNSLGILHRRRGDVDRALAVTAEGLELARRAGDRKGQAELVGSLAHIHATAGDLAASERSSRTALALAEQAGAPPGLVAVLLSTLASTLSQRGEVEESLRTLDRIQRLPPVEGVHHHGAFITEALLSRGLGEIDRAEAQARRGLEAAERSGNREDVLTCEYDLAIILADERRFDEAAERLGRLVEAFDRAGRAREALYAANSLATLSIERGDMETALRWNRQALRRLQDNPGKFPDAAGEAHHDRSRIARNRGDLDGSVLAATDQVEAERRFGRPAYIAAALEWRGELYEAAGRDEEAERDWREAMALRSKLRAALLPAESVLSLERRRADAWRRLALMKLRQEGTDPGPAAGRRNDAFLLLDDSRARRLLEALSRPRPAAVPDLADGEGRRAAHAAISALQSELLRGAPDAATRARIEADLLLAEDRLRRAAREETVLPPPEAPAAPLDLEALGRALRETRSALVTFLLGPDAGYALLHDGTAIHALRLDRWEEIAAIALRVEPLLRLPPDSSGAPPSAPALERLARTLVDPWMEVLPEGTRRLLIVPDGALERVPFEALPLRDAGGATLGGRYVTAYLPSAATWLALRSRPHGKPTGRVLALAPDPGSGFAPLPEGRREAERWAARGGWGSRCVAGAGEATLRATDLTGFDVLHIAAHGVADTAHPLRSGLVLGPGGSGGDDFLGMREIPALRLTAPLVVLAACRSGVGPTDRAEGVIALPTAFLEAGARGAVATLWEVPDGVAARFMSRFLEALATSGRPADALRAVRSEFAASRDARLRHPSAWAPFIYVGDPDAEVRLPALGVQRARGLIVLAALAVVSAVAILWARRRAPAQAT